MRDDFVSLEFGLFEYSVFVIEGTLGRTLFLWPAWRVFQTPYLVWFLKACCGRSLIIFVQVWLFLDTMNKKNYRICLKNKKWNNFNAVFLMFRSNKTLKWPENKDPLLTSLLQYFFLPKNCFFNNHLIAYKNYLRNFLWPCLLSHFVSHRLSISLLKFFSFDQIFFQAFLLNYAEANHRQNIRKCFQNHSKSTACTQICNPNNKIFLSIFLLF